MTVPVYWLIFGMLCMALEGFGISGIGFLFAGIGAFLVAILIEASMLGVDAYVAQFAWFFGFTVLSAALLWRPIKSWRITRKGMEYSNIIGERAVVHKAILLKGREGNVMWSGTPMIAELLSSSAVESVAVGENVVIKDIKGNKLLVDVE